jgi:DCN1-like protein 3
MGNCASAKSTTFLERSQIVKSLRSKKFLSNSSDERPQPRRDDLKQVWRSSIDRLSIRSKKASNIVEQKHQEQEKEQVVNEAKIIQLFNKYCSKDETDTICADGVEELCKDLLIEPNDFQLLVLAWKLDAKKMCKFSKKEFINGLRDTFNVDNLNDLKLKLSLIEFDLISNQNEFKNLYKWTFDFGLDEGERTLPLDIAILLWQLVYDKNSPLILNRWLEFLKLDSNQIKGIPRDTWCMFQQFSRTIGNFNFESYDDNEAWPCIFDEFVQYELKLKKQKIT